MIFRNKDVPLLLGGKTATGRPTDFKVHTGKWHKAISDRKLGYFGEIFIESAEIRQLNTLTFEEWLEMGYYCGLEEYLKEPFNNGLTGESEKLIIKWSKFKPRWEVIEQILLKMSIMVVKK